MKMKLIALAVAGLATSGAFAQMNVKITGKVDLGIAHYSGTSTSVSNGLGAKTRMESGFANGASKVVLEGTEDLGGGMRVSFKVDSAVTADGGVGQAAPAGIVFGGRNSSLTLTTGYGSISAGRMGNSGKDWYVASYDPFADNGFNCGSCLVNGGAIGTTNNTLRYASPNMSGFVVMYDFAMSENQGAVAATTTGSQSTLSVAYDKGPISLMATQMISRDVSATTALGRSLTTNGVGASYDFGVAKLMGQLWDEKTTVGTTLLGVRDTAPSVDQRNWLLGVDVPMGAHNFLASYRVRDSRLVLDQDVRSWSLGYKYAMSKRTSLHAYGSQLSNTNNGTASYGGTGVAGSGNTNGYFAGMSHTF